MTATSCVIHFHAGFRKNRKIGSIKREVIFKFGEEFFGAISNIHSMEIYGHKQAMMVAVHLCKIDMSI